MVQYANIWRSPGTPKSRPLAALIMIRCPWFLLWPYICLGKYIHNTYFPIIVYKSGGREAAWGIHTNSSYRTISSA